jgi:tRNA-2-methylthio-N6-dimethylallyladenosine synthase
LTEQRKRRFFVQTFGCQMNVNDSERVAGLLRQQGYEAATDEHEADFVFLNTCAVREKAALKLRHAIGRLRRLKRDRPELRIGVGGCVAQLEGRAIIERSPVVDVLVGTHTLHRVPELLEQAHVTGSPAVDLDRAADPFAIPPSAVAHGNPVRAYVTAMEGCNHVCSFCVVPRTRGPEVNRPACDIVEEVRSLVGRGFPEVMLLGQTVNAYRQGGIDFAELLAQVDAVPGLERLRFTTSHPEHVGERMANALRDLPRLCPYLHLPFQSGSDRVLASMRRGYTRARYLEVIAMLRERVPGLALSTDVIVGYPGETESEFEQTLDVLAASGFDNVFAFTYSPRPGTTAFRLNDDVPETLKQRRLQVVLSRQQQLQRQQNGRLVGGVEPVLVEEQGEQGRASGRTPHFRIVHFDGSPGLVGRVVPVEITAAGANSLQGRIISQPIH